MIVSPLMTHPKTMKPSNLFLNLWSKNGISKEPSTFFFQKKYYSDLNNSQHHQ